MTQHNTQQDTTSVENAEFGDRVYFTVEYDAGNIMVPEGTGAMIRDEQMPDEISIEDNCHTVDIDLDGRYYEIEVPYDVLAMQ